MRSTLRRRTSALALGAAMALVAGDAAPGPDGTGAAAPTTLSYPAAPLPAVPNDHVPEIEASVRAITADTTFKGAAIGIVIVDVDTGHYLAAANEHEPLNPASNAKLYTAAAALAMLHGDHRYETTLSGKVKGSAVAGPLVLRGHGDPSLRSGDLWELVQDLRARGIKKIEGDILVDQRFFDDQTTPPAFDQQPNEWAAFRAPVSAVAVNENTVTLTVRPTSDGNPAQVTFDPPGFVDVDGTVKSVDGGADTVGLVLSGNGKRLAAKLSGAIALDSKVARYTRRVDDPSLLAGFVLKALLEEADIHLGGEVKAGTNNAGSILARHTSAPLGTLLYELGKVSDNFYAEMVFKSLAGEVRGRPAKSADSSDVVTRWLTKVGAMDAGMVIKNGSGLFDANRVTAASCAQLLRVAWRDPAIQNEYVAQLAIGGVDGTLKNRFPNEKHRRAVRAKTGTLDDAIALGGYVLGPPGKGPIAYSILFNKVEGKAHGARHAADKLVEIIAKRLWGE
jgi:D-alanyl-D-alanine carboxypeptidase/D-alanyl-D-alanine-endopeptidase (penicillin-binding protein 4)